MIEPSSSEDESETESDFSSLQPDSRGLCLPPGYQLPPGRRSSCSPRHGTSANNTVTNNSFGIAKNSKSRNSVLSNGSIPSLTSNNVHRTSGSTTKRPSSPTPSLETVKPPEKALSEEAEEEERKLRMQIYVFVLRCVAYPFNAKQPTDMARRQLKMTASQLESYKNRFSAFLRGELAIPTDEAFCNAVEHYFNVFLRSLRVEKMVKSGGASASDFREVFKKMIEKRVRSLPEIDGLSKETVLNSWLSKFDSITRGDEDGRKGASRISAAMSEMTLGKEELYNMFQQILGIKRFEHQLLYNAMQLDNADEQAAVIRRELDRRCAHAETMAKQKKLPKFLHKEMESMYLEELNSQVQMLMHNLDSLPVSRGGVESRYSLHRLKKNQKEHIARALKIVKWTHNNALLEGSDDQELTLSKNDIALSFNIEVTVIEVQNLKNLDGNKIVYCTMEVDGGEKLQTDHAEASKPVWDTQGDFQTSQPLPVIKVKLFTENTSMLSLDDKELGRIVLSIQPNFPRHQQWHNMTVVGQKGKDNTKDQLRIKLKILMDRPQNVKNCGYLFGCGKNVWKKWKKRFMVLIQVSQYTFAFCSYREKKSDPAELMQLDGFTVDYSEPQPGMEGAKFFFSAVKEGDSVYFAAENECERSAWITALVRATGQSYRPEAPSKGKSNSMLAKEESILSHESTKSVVPLKDSPTRKISHFIGINPQKTIAKLQQQQRSAQVKPKGDTRKSGMDEFINADVLSFNHASLFKKLQHLTLEYRLNDSYSCLGWLSPGQVFLLDEYCARYGVRGCLRHLYYQFALLDKADLGFLIDPTLLHYSFAFCASHIHGNRPDGIGTVTQEEKEKFEGVKERLRNLLEHQITHFRYCFPFGRPEGALKATVSLLERVMREEKNEVMMKDIVTPVAPDDVCKVVKKCLEAGALVNYDKISAYAQVEDDGYDGEKMCPAKRLENVIRLAELCCEVLQQNEEYHADAFSWFENVMKEHAEMFWSMFLVDMNAALEIQPPDTWDSFPLFQIINDYLRTCDSLKNGKFHTQLCDLFAPQVIRYVDLMESSVSQSIQKGFEKEKWDPHGNGCGTSEDIFWKLTALQNFITDLHWPDAEFAEHLDYRLKLLAADMVEQMVKRSVQAFEASMQKGKRDAGYVLPSDVCVMINVVVDCEDKADKLTRVQNDNNPYHHDVPGLVEKALSGFNTLLNERFSGILENTLNSLARYDETNLLSSFFSFTTSVKSKVNIPTFAKPSKPGQDKEQQKPGQDLALPFVTFVRTNQQRLREKVNSDDFVSDFFEVWYKRIMKQLAVWLTVRSTQLHIFQLVTLVTVVKKTYKAFLLEGLMPGDLETKDYETVKTRLKVEETTASMGENSHFLTDSINDKSDVEDD